MSWRRRRVYLPREDHRTEVLVKRMDRFLVEMQVVADRLIAELEDKGRADDDRA